MSWAAKRSNLRVGVLLESRVNSTDGTDGARTEEEHDSETGGRWRLCRSRETSEIVE